MRVFSVYGHNDKEDMFMSSLIEKMINKEHISMTKGVQLWDYLHCDDAARAFYLVGEKIKTSAVYCLGSGESRPLKEYTEILAKELNYTEPIGYGEIPYSPESVMNLCADISNLNEDTGWLPIIGFERGIRKTISTYL